MGIKKGDLILKSQPFAYALKNDHRGSVCDFCFSHNDDLKKCSQCLFTYYCNKKCQKSAWKDHKEECTNLHRIHPEQPDEFVRLIARIIYKLKRDPDVCESFGNVKRSFKDLMSHSEEIKNDTSRMNFFTSINKMINHFLPSKDCPSYDELLEIFGKSSINSFTITKETQILGIGLYLGPSMIDHSCQPNAAEVFDGPNLLISALEDIPELDTSNVFISYTDVMASSKERQESLKEIYYFDCTCNKCQDEEKDLITNSIRCSNAKCTHPTVIKKNSFSCLKCGEVKFEENKLLQMEELIEICKKTLNEIDELKNEKMYDKIFEKTSMCLEKTKSTLHCFNVHYARILVRAFENNLLVQKWQLACKLGDELLLSFRYHYGRFHPLASMQHYRIGIAFYHSSNFVEAKRIACTALDELSVTYPKDHLLYHSCIRLCQMCEMQLTEFNIF